MNDEWGTPIELFHYLDKRFHFNLDPCSNPNRHLSLSLDTYYTKMDDGLSKKWFGPVFMNPPYSQGNINKWVKKAYEESLLGEIVVGLIRRDSSTKWWNEYVRHKTWEMPVPYRIKFEGAPSAYNFPSTIVVWHGMENMLRESR